ncbi:basic amino acid/polyamine antiporter [Raoultibacter massiliensis]|uniref:basic amino acid/polyamine antiporter n=1 Tax=Raoultibacter massiliensis TaxID=1852371 RepID=UPI003A9538D1
MADKTSSGSSGAPTQDNSKKVGLIGLVGIVISAMIGGGIYNLPQNMAQDASAGAIIIAWIVTGVGIWFIANTFRILSAARPELTNGLYAYAEKGFGKLIGFFVAYGYWICNCFALVAYSVLIMATLNYFIPDFAGGNNIPSIIGGSIITWIMYFLALRGAKQTSFLNIIGTIGKLVPVIIFILAVATIFKFSVFMEGFWGMKDGVALTLDWSNVMPQVQSTMLVTLWLFLGIEGAVVVSGRAKSQAAVRKATMIGFLVTLGLYVIVSLLPLGVDTQEAVGKMADPSMAAIMLQSFGSWGEIMVNAGVIISVLSSWLVWMLMLGEMPFAASKSGIFPTAFEKENKKGAPSISLLWTTIVIQVVLIASYFIGSNAWTTMISITSVMALPCYLFCTLFLFKIALKKDGYPKGIFASRTSAIVTGVIGSAYGLWLIYAAGLNYLMVACIVYAIGIPLYIVGVKQHNAKAQLFNKRDKIIVAVVIALGIAGVVYSVMSFGHF